MDIAKIRNKVKSEFKLFGLTLSSGAADIIVEKLTNCENEINADEFIKAIISNILKHQTDSSHISKESISDTISLISETTKYTKNTLLLLNAFDCPNIDYSTEKRKFLLLNPETTLFANTDKRLQLLRKRYSLIHQRTLRHDLFSDINPEARFDSNSKKFNLKSIEELLSTSYTLKEIVVLGMLSQRLENQWCLEDLTGSVPLDLSNVHIHFGLFTEGCFVLVEGVYKDNIFHASAIGFPPPEPKKTTKSYVTFDDQEIFKNAISVPLFKPLSTSSMFVVLSDVWLDKPEIIEKLETLFQGFADYPPACFIFMGSFISNPFMNMNIPLYVEHFGKICNMIIKHEKLAKNSCFVFVPSLNDPVPSTVFPRASLPKKIAEVFKGKVSHVLFPTNPCRLYCNDIEIVIFREDILTKLCRNLLKFPDTDTVPQHFAKTLVTQASLLPLSLQMVPIYWNFDYAFRLHPLPDVIICADKCDKYSTETVNCTIFNPGSFQKSNYSFSVLYPLIRKVEDSQVVE